MATDPQMTTRLASAAPLALRSQSSAIQTTTDPWNDPVLALRPATKDEFRTELTSCLVLCAPSGMSDDDRNEWLRTAWATLRDVPTDLLKRGCDVARRRCDHPAKIVPVIMAEVEEPLRTRRRRFAPKNFERQEPEMTKDDYCKPEEAAAIIAEFGLDLSSDRPEPRRHDGPARMPTAADYAAMGVTIGGTDDL